MTRARPVPGWVYVVVGLGIPFFMALAGTELSRRVVGWFAAAVALVALVVGVVVLVARFCRWASHAVRHEWKAYR